MELAHLLPEENILLDIDVSGKKQALEYLSSCLAGQLKTDPLALLDALTEREKLGSTGVGGGVALPHARLKKIDRIHCLFARTARPIDFEATDGNGVRLIFMLLVPEEAGADYLQALSCLTQAVRSDDFRERLLSAQTAQEAHALFLSACPASGK